MEAAAGELGSIDSLVCNVSTLAVGDTPESWEKSFRTDMMHTVNAPQDLSSRHPNGIDRHRLQRVRLRD
jgi:hypothetical protein